MARRILSALLASTLALAAFGCSHPYYAPAPPPPPGLGQPPLVSLAERNGFVTGRTDGARDAYNGFPFGARRTRAYHDTPGYDGQLGPFGVYRNAFRDAYLRGYTDGYQRR